jgi:starch phosphorylase
MPRTKPTGSEASADIAGFDSLSELALNLRWSWNHATDRLWRELDPRQWELTHNPWAVLQTVWER